MSSPLEAALCESICRELGSNVNIVVHHRKMGLEIIVIVKILLLLFCDYSWVIKQQGKFQNKYFGNA